MIALITGGASGIGRAIATAMVKDGNEVVIADLDATGAKRAADELGEKASGFALDVTDPSAVQALVDKVVTENGSIDFIFNNAGIGSGGPAESLALAEWRRIIEVDLMGVINGVVAAYPHMIKQGSGHIINTASLAGLSPAPMLAAYAAAKHGVVGLSLSLRVEAAQHGVKVSAICPGPVDTPMLDDTGRALLAAMGPPYSPESLAKDVMEGLRQNLALIVAPESARAVWQQHRTTPSSVVDAMARHLSSRP